MASGLRNAAVGLLMGMMLTGTPCSAAETANRRLSISLHNGANVDAETIQQATAIVTRVFAEAGIDVEWHTGPIPEEPTVGPVRHVGITIQSPGITARMAVPRHVLGVAQGCAADKAVAAQIFYANVVSFAIENSEGIARVLGYAICHEIGHLLLPIRGHAASGLMSANWGKAELRAMSQGSTNLRSLLERHQLVGMR